jgi:hypothetical protein
VAHLGAGYALNGSGVLTVQLSDDADGYVIADAVRLQLLVSEGVQVTDDGDPGFTATASFEAATDQGYLGDVRYAPPGDGSGEATWTFSVIPGIYRVSVTWTPHPNRATNAPFSVYDGSTLLASVLVNQEEPPLGFAYDGTMWDDLGAGVFIIAGDQLVVRLTDNANDYVIADAIRIERLA